MRLGTEHGRGSKQLRTHVVLRFFELKSTSNLLPRLLRALVRYLPQPFYIAPFPLSQPAVDVAFQVLLNLVLCHLVPSQILEIHIIQLPFSVHDLRFTTRCTLT